MKQFKQYTLVSLVVALAMVVVTTLAVSRTQAGDLLVSSLGTASVLRFDGTTGAVIGVFVPPGSGGLSNPRGMTLGPDGNLYVSSSTLSEKPLNVT